MMTLRKQTIEKLSHAYQLQQKIQLKHEKFLCIASIVDVHDLDLCDRVRKQFQLQLSHTHIELFLICYEQFLGFQIMSKTPDSEMELMLNYRIPYDDVSIELL